MEYLAGYTSKTREFFDKTVALLTSDWLLQDPSAADMVNEARRQSELQKIRAAYIPELVFRLHTVLLESGKELLPKYAVRANRAITADSC